MPIVKFRRLPETVEAIQWTGSNAEEVVEFAGFSVKFVDGQLHLKNYDYSLSEVPVGYWLVRKTEGEGMGMVVSYPESVLLMLFEPESFPEAKEEEEKGEKGKPKRSRLRDHLRGLVIE